MIALLYVLIISVALAAFVFMFLHWLVKPTRTYHLLTIQVVAKDGRFNVTSRYCIRTYNVFYGEAELSKYLLDKVNEKGANYELKDIAFVILFSMRLSKQEYDAYNNN